MMHVCTEKGEGGERKLETENCKMNLMQSSAEKQHLLKSWMRAVTSSGDQFLSHIKQIKIQCENFVCMC